MSNGPAPWLVVGLGNPGPGYAKNRHNVGFMIADLLAERIGAKFGRARRAATEVAEGFLGPGGPKLVIAKPTTFMNLFGSTDGWRWPSSTRSRRPRSSPCMTSWISTSARSGSRSAAVRAGTMACARSPSHCPPRTMSGSGSASPGRRGARIRPITCSPTSPRPTQGTRLPGRSRRRHRGERHHHRRRADSEQVPLRVRDRREPRRRRGSAGLRHLRRGSRPIRPTAAATHCSSGYGRVVASIRAE